MYGFFVMKVIYLRPYWLQFPISDEYETLCLEVNIQGCGLSALKMDGHIRADAPTDRNHTKSGATNDAGADHIWNHVL